MSTESLVMSIPEFAKAVGISRGLCYDLARRDKLPVPVLFIGNRRMVVSRKAVEMLLSGNGER